MPKDKGKGIASSSKSSRLSKHRKLVLHKDDATASQGHRETRDDPPITYVWGTGPLSQYDKELQPNLYHDKINKQVGRKEAFICEREVSDSEFRPFGIIQRFEALGWEAALKCYDGEEDVFYMSMIQEWMATLEVKWGRTRKEMSLTGMVKGKPVVMSFQTLNTIAKFDSKAENRYTYPDEKELYKHPDRNPLWQDMLKTLYVPNWGNILDRDNLKLPVRLMLTFVTQNIMPRRSDKHGVRYWEIPILYSLMTGEPLISFRYLVMMNIWDAREKKDKKIVPHCRLITALIKKAKAFDFGATGIQKDTPPFTCKNLSKQNWDYQRTDRYLILRFGPFKTWKVRNPDSMIGDEEEEAEILEQQPVNVDETIGGAQGPIPGASGREYYTGWGPQQARGGPFFGQGASRYYYPYGTPYVDIDQFVEDARPPVYDEWGDDIQALFDQNTRGFELIRRDLQRNHDHTEHWHQVHTINTQVESNLKFLDDLQRRLYGMWHRKEPIVKNPPMVDYTSIPPNDGSVSYPEPAIHHSPWIDPFQMQNFMQGHYQQQPPDQGSSSGGVGGAYDYSSWMDTMKSLLGDPRSPYS